MGFRQHMLSMPAISYSVHPTEHAEKIQLHMLAGLAEYFPVEKAKPKTNDAMSPETFQLVRHKASVHKVVSFLGRKVRVSVCQFAVCFLGLCHQ